MRYSALLRFFYCGKGDTVLLQASPAGGGPSEWALVDCHLTKESGAYWRIRDLIQKERIRRLRFVCLTHPDRDHYFGMRQLLKDCFYDNEKDDLRVGEFWDSGVEFTMLSAIGDHLGIKVIKTELDDLYRDFLARLILADKLEYQEMVQGTVATTGFGDFQLLSISPHRNCVVRFNEQGVEKILGTRYVDVESAREESNNLSVVLVLTHKTLPVNIVLGGDATVQAWDKALDKWPEFARKLRCDGTRFQAVKVSHHGAKSGHHASLYENCCQKGETVAVLTVGPGDSSHPHKDVLKLLKRRNIRTYLTCWPTGEPCTAKSSMPLPGARVGQTASQNPRLQGYDCADIEIAVRPDGRLTVSPRRARIF